MAGFGPGLTVEYGCLYRGGPASLKEAVGEPIAEPPAGALPLGAVASPGAVVINPKAAGAVAAAAADDGASTPEAIAATAARAEKSALAASGS